MADDGVAGLIDTLEVAHGQWVNGSVHPIYDLTNGTVFGPFGGPAVGGPGVSERQAAIAGEFHEGTSRFEVVRAFAAGDLVCVIAVEWGTTRFGDDPRERPWTLRTTQLFRQDEDGWTLLHRHADPLIERRDAEATFALAKATSRP
jgi:ketosteroid isomerase-like protein